jgi:hypothetical protein
MTWMDPFAERLEVLIEEKRDLAERELAREVWVLLARFGLAEMLVRFPHEAEIVALHPAAKRPRKIRPRIERPQTRWRWIDTPEMRGWRAEIMGVILRAPAHQRQRTIGRLVERVHTLPDGTRVRVSRARLTAWIADAKKGARPVGPSRRSGVAPAPALLDPPFLRPLNSMGQVGIPTELSPEMGHEADEHRDTNCASYGTCLAVAVRRRWDAGFSCGACIGTGRIGFREGKQA